MPRERKIKMTVASPESVPIFMYLNHIAFRTTKTPYFRDPMALRMAKTPNLTLLHSERPKLYRVLAILSAVGLNAWLPYCCTETFPSGKPTSLCNQAHLLSHNNLFFHYICTGRRNSGCYHSGTHLHHILWPYLR